MTAGRSMHFHVCVFVMNLCVCGWTDTLRLNDRECDDVRISLTGVMKFYKVSDLLNTANNTTPVNITVVTHERC